MKETEREEVVDLQRRLEILAERLKLRENVGSFEWRTRQGWHIQTAVVAPGGYPYAEPYDGFEPAPDGYGGWGILQAGVESNTETGMVHPMVLWQRWLAPKEV